jgi:hypothetical protein
MLLSVISHITIFKRVVSAVLLSVLLVVSTLVSQLPKAGRSNSLSALVIIVRYVPSPELLPELSARTLIKMVFKNSIKTRQIVTARVGFETT